MAKALIAVLGVDQSYWRLGGLVTFVETRMGVVILTEVVRTKHRDTTGKQF
jgi:hypothetical protein